MRKRGDRLSAANPAGRSCPSSCAGGAADEAASGDAETPTGSYVSVTDQQGSRGRLVGALRMQITRESKNNQSLAEGTVTNPTDANQSRLYIAFNEGRDTQAKVQVDIESVEPGETSPGKRRLQ